MLNQAQIDETLSTLLNDGNKTVTIEGRSYTRLDIDTLIALRDRVMTANSAGTIQGASIMRTKLRRETARSGY